MFVLRESLLECSFCQSDVADVKQLLSMGHWSLSRQLHWSWALGLVSMLVTFLLCLLIIDCILSIQL